MSLVDRALTAIMARIYDRFMAPTEEACLADWRRELLGELSGDVLEIGAGTGANLAHYPRDANLTLTLLEPEPLMRRQLEERLQESPIPARVLDASAEALPADDGAFDAVVCTLVLCTVPRPEYAARELYRVLKPGGTLHLIEHVAAHDNPGRYRWQRRLEPAWKRLAGGCHLTRHTAELLEAVGFRFADDGPTRESIRKALPIIRPSIRGIARKPHDP